MTSVRHTFEHETRGANMLFDFLKSLFDKRSPYSADDEHEKQVFQYSTINALIEGLYDGSVTYGELKQHGNFGLGTFDALDGEMAAFDGQFYQIKQDGKLYSVSDDQKTPFAVVTHFHPDEKLTIEESCSYADLQEYLGNKLSSNNLIYAIRVDCFFEHIRVRVIPRQSPPYPPMTEVAKHQPQFVHGNLQGTICGFRFPKYASNINVPGYHMHFVSKDKTTGGHLLDAHMRGLTIQYEEISGFHLQLPAAGQFLRKNLDEDRTSAIEQVEKQTS